MKFQRKLISATIFRNTLLWKDAINRENENVPQKYLRNCLMFNSMISINDYDTGFQIMPGTIKRLKSLSFLFIDQLNSVPIFFVKEKTMDDHSRQILSLKRNCIKEMIKSLRRERIYGERPIEPDPIYSDLMYRRERIYGEIPIDSEQSERIIWECRTHVPAVGCYIGDADDISDKPHILICQERIKYRSRQQFEDLLIFIIIHELAHAYLAPGKLKNKTAGHIIEESLCEAYAFSRFSNTDNIFDFVTDIARPPEYTSFKFWIELSRFSPLALLLFEWSTGNERSFLFSVSPESLQIRHLFDLNQLAMEILSFS